MFENNRKARPAKLSIAPLLDMIFILLIFFVVTTTFSKMPGISIEKPSSSQVQLLDPASVVVGLTKVGEILIEGRSASESELGSWLASKKLEKNHLAVVIMADKEAILQHVVRIMDICEEQGIHAIGIAEEPKQ